MWANLRGNSLLWWNEIQLHKLELHPKEYEQLLLEKWSHAKRKENASPNSLPSSLFHRGVQIEIPKEATKKYDESCKDSRKKDNEHINGLSSSGISLL